MPRGELTLTNGTLSAIAHKDVIPKAVVAEAFAVAGFEVYTTWGHAAEDANALDEIAAHIILMEFPLPPQPPGLEPLVNCPSA